MFESFEKRGSVSVNITTNKNTGLILPDTASLRRQSSMKPGNLSRKVSEASTISNSSEYQSTGEKSRTRKSNIAKLKRAALVATSFKKAPKKNVFVPDEHVKKLVSALDPERKGFDDVYLEDDDDDLDLPPIGPLNAPSRKNSKPSNDEGSKSVSRKSLSLTGKTGSKSLSERAATPGDAARQNNEHRPSMKLFSPSNAKEADIGADNIPQVPIADDKGSQEAPLEQNQEIKPDPAKENTDADGNKEIPLDELQNPENDIKESETSNATGGISNLPIKIKKKVAFPLKLTSTQLNLLGNATGSFRGPGDPYVRFLMGGKSIPASAKRTITNAIHATDAGQMDEILIGKNNGKMSGVTMSKNTGAIERLRKKYKESFKESVMEKVSTLEETRV